MNKDKLKSKELDLLYERYTLDELREWVDQKIKDGYKKVEMEYEWGYYDEVTSAQMVATK